MGLALRFAPCRRHGRRSQDLRRKVRLGFCKTCAGHRAFSEKTYITILMVFV